MMRSTRFFFLLTSLMLTAASCSDDEPLTIPVEPSLEITFVEDAPVGDAASAFELISRAYVKNITDQPVHVKVRRSIEQPTILTDNNSICWEYCYVESIDESPDAITLQPGEINQDYYFSAPLNFVPNLSEGPQLQALRRRFVLLPTGEGPYEDPSESWRMGQVLGSKGVPIRVDFWGDDYRHDWTTWREMLPKYLGEMTSVD